MNASTVRIAFALIMSFVCIVETVAQGDAKKPPPDGIYYILEKGDGFKTTRNDNGKLVVIGEKITGSLGIPIVHARTNDNSNVGLSFKAGPFPVGESKGPFAVLIGGHCLPVFVWSGPNPDNTYLVTVSVKGANTVLAITKLAGVESKLRKHPGHKLAAKFEVDKTVYEPKERVNMTMTIQNVGEVAVTFQAGLQHAHRDNDFGFTAIRGDGFGKAVPDTCDPGDFLGIGIDRTLKPGESFKKTVRLDERFKFDDDDNYSITCTYRTRLIDPNEKHRVLWDDFAAGTCSVFVRAKEK
jgi:hypothetical protein